MTQLHPRLEAVITRLRELPPEAQEPLAEAIERELEPVTDGDAEWERLLADPRSENLLEELARDAVAQHRRGETRPFLPGGYGDA